MFVTVAGSYSVTRCTDEELSKGLLLQAVDQFMQFEQNMGAVGNKYTTIGINSFRLEVVKFLEKLWNVDDNTITNKVDRFRGDEATR